MVELGNAKCGWITYYKGITNLLSEDGMARWECSRRLTVFFTKVTQAQHLPTMATGINNHYVKYIKIWRIENSVKY